MTVTLDLETQILASAMTFVTDYIARLQSLTEIVNGIEQLVSGKLPQDLIPHEVLTSELQALQSDLQGIEHVCFTQYAYYYLKGKIITFRSGSTLTISLEVPLSAFDGRSTLYE
jgi:hypothetical protein